MKTLKVAHLTSVHPRGDTRILLKECSSLAKAGYDVYLVVADGRGDERRDGIQICDVGSSRGRLDRMVNVVRRVFKRADELDADVYHLHDPELIPVGLSLKRKGKLVLFDSHEDIPKDISSKEYLPHAIRPFVSYAATTFERCVCSRLDGIVAATPFIRDKFIRINPCTVDINNFPILGELETNAADWSVKCLQVVYVGGISRIRGALEVVRAMGELGSATRLCLAGTFSDVRFEQALKAEPSWMRVDEKGFLDRSGVRIALAESIAGIVTLHPIVSYLDALPIKMFEYMSAGIPVIASNFPRWREIIEGNLCGICVNPLDSQEIAKAIDYLATHPVEAEQMGRNGKQAVRDRYNWGVEESKLLKLYQGLSGRLSKSGI